MRVSLVVTVNNEGPALDRLIEGVHRQDRAPDEWIVVDRGSHDGTAQRLAEVEQCRVLIHPGNTASARNRGVSAATGEVVVMTDAGCELPSEWLASLVEPLERDLCVLVGGPTRPVLQRPFDLVQWSLLAELDVGTNRRGGPRLSCRNVAFRRELWERCAFPEWLDHGEDAWVFHEWEAFGAVCKAETPAVHWEPPATLGSVFQQHQRSQRGDGVARMRRLSNSLRLAFYGSFFVSLLGALLFLEPLGLVVPVAAWSIYVAANGARYVRLVARERRWRWLLPGLLRLPIAIVVLDAGKVAGFLGGLLAPAPSASERQRST